jgi:ubiquinone biosynthesis protein
MPLKYIDHKQLFHEVTAVANRNNLILPRDLVLLGKSFVTLMSTVEWLDPDCDLTRIASPFARSALLRRFSPKKLALDAQDMANEMMRLSRETPRAVRQLLRNAVKGELQVQFKHTNLDNVVLDIDRSINRLSLSILTGAIVVGSSLVADKNLGVPYVGLIGFGFAFVLSVVLILGILNSGKL